MASAGNMRFSIVVRTAAVVVAVVAAGGCVQRRMTIRSNPPGAQVYVDNQEIGRTPVSTDFIYYGRRQIRLVKDGYETLTVEQQVRPPWYQIPGIDFVVENLWPWEIRDERRVDLEMQPQLVVPSETLLARAENLRVGGGVLPQPTANVAPQPQTVPGAPYAPVPNSIPVPNPTGGAPTVPGYTPAPALPNYVPNSPPSTAPTTSGYGGQPVAPLP